MLLCLPVMAQDARNRATETIVQDVLALVPIQNQADFNNEMQPLVAAAPKSITMLAAMLKPAAQRVNAKVEYAIHGAVAFAGTNEVTMEWKAPTEENLSVQNGYNQDFVDAVRATGGKNSRTRNNSWRTNSVCFRRLRMLPMSLQKPRRPMRKPMTNWSASAVMLARKS